MVHHEVCISAVPVLVLGQIHNMAVNGSQDTIASAKDYCSLWLHTILEILDIVTEENPVQ